MTDPPSFLYADDPDKPGWKSWELSDPTRFNSLLGPFKVRLEADGSARVRMVPRHIHSNLRNAVHGGTTLAFIDIALFAAARSFGLITAGTAVTLDLSTQFIGAGRIDEPLDAVVELLRETGRLLFLRGLIVQGDDRIASFSATIRKPTPRK
ncbi:PaaI family thioesterase [Sphingomonas gilva]|uniref:PaaI family thioesterase n=1 Tax=Sphingomonas gilva TaxID=2305907 RepID=A0A396RQT9_9SPHN|nr:PaaI family thioesterase [Sphingomonas gilva]RHW18984.1 PaaI family thioesterase [Sphingomonas gilva]